jgi:hypothetical protein
MLALFHRRSAVLPLLALVAAIVSVYYQVFLRASTETEKMTAQISRSVIQAVFAEEQAEVSFISPCYVRYGLTEDGRRVSAPESVALLAPLSFVISLHS